MITLCTLDAKSSHCDNKCAGCGWNIKNRQMREKMAAENKLTHCKDGLSRLIIKREESKE